MKDTMDIKVLIGKQVDEAALLIRENDFTPRITKLDGKPMLVTRDFKTNRVNLNVENGSVIEATIG